MHWRLTRLLVTGALALGCSQETGTGASPIVTAITEPVLPTSTLGTAAREVPAWMEELPAAEASLAKGERVWAAVAALPRAGMVEVGVFQIEAAYEGRYTLVDRMGQRIDGVPAAVVHRLGEAKGLRENDVVLISTKTAPGLVGRVAELVPGAEIRVRYDFGGATRVAAVDHAEPVRSGTGPLAYVSFPKSAGRSRGLVVARSDDRVWIRTGSGHVEIHPQSSIQALPIATDVAVGARVRAFRWASGLRLGTVVEAIEPGLRYRVRLDGHPTPSDYFFANLSPSG